MQITLAVVLVAVLNLNPVLADDSSCKNTCPVVAFSSSYQSMMNLTYSNDVTDGLTITGEEAAEIVSKLLYEALLYRGVPNSADIADLQAKEISDKIKVMTLEEYFRVVGDSMGGTLCDCGLIDGGNVVSEVVKAVKYIQARVQDPNSFESYWKATVPGRIDYFDNEVHAGDGKCAEFQKYSDTTVSYFNEALTEYALSKEQ